MMKYDKFRLNGKSYDILEDSQEILDNLYNLYPVVHKKIKDKIQ